MPDKPLRCASAVGLLQAVMPGSISTAAASPEGSQASICIATGSVIVYPQAVPGPAYLPVTAPLCFLGSSVFWVQDDVAI